MFNVVRLADENERLQLYLWRENEEVELDMYIVLMNNMGIKPSGSIAATAL